MSNDGQRGDRRSRKTVASLHAALGRLLEKSDVGDLTVSDICRAADVHRATFYLHFTDVRALLVDLAEKHLARLAASFEPVQMENRDLGAPPEQLVKVFRDVKAHPALYRAIVEGGGIGAFHPRLMDIMRSTGVGRIGQIGGPSRLVENELVVSAAVGQVLGAISWWLAKGMTRSPSYMADRTGWLLVSGAYPLLGLKPPSVT